MSVNDRRQREFERREQEILGAALDLIRAGDWGTITMDHIAERAEVGKGTIYKHFRSKDEVAARLVAESGRELLARWDQVDRDLPYIARFKEILRQYWWHTLERSEMYGVVMYCDALHEHLNLGEDVQTEYLGVRGRILGFATETLQEGIRLGILRNPNATHLLLTTWGAVSGITRLVQNGSVQGLETDGYLEYLCDCLLAGMMTADGRETAN